jgi:transcriptional regulator with XRE-family HTH domain
MQAEWFAGRLRELREAKGSTQQQLADAAGLKLGGIRDLEQGRRSPTWETVVALCKALGVTADAFLQEPQERLAAGPGRPRKAVMREEGSLRAPKENVPQRGKPKRRKGKSK